MGNNNVLLGCINVSDDLAPGITCMMYSICCFACDCEFFQFLTPESGFLKLEIDLLPVLFLAYRWEQLISVLMPVTVCFSL